MNYHDELIDMSYCEFSDALATAKSKRMLRARLTPQEEYLIKHAVSIEVCILEREADGVAYPTRRYGNSDDISDDAIHEYFAHVGASGGFDCPSSRW